ncbi:MAG TPA: hypothetical protein VK811_07395 [Candidatus Acidoferrum sp.]|nr:hypothetical protein [Candidatus Acidoferrum sp.]
MKKKPAKATPPAGPQIVIDWPVLIVTVLVGIFAAGLVIAQFYDAQDPRSQVSLSNLSDLIPRLQETTNPIERDGRYGIGLSAMGRELDGQLPPDTRIFITGMVGTNCTSLGYYYFLRNYLFPRDVEISLDGHATFYRENWVIGVPCDSPEVLRSNGFDLMIGFPNNNPQFVALTPKVMPKSQ